MKYFTYKYKKSTNLGKIYLLPETDKRLNSVPGRPVISNCGAPAEKASEFLHFHLKRFMKNGASYINDSNKFIKKIKKIDISNDATAYICDVNLESVLEKLEQNSAVTWQ